MIDFFFNVEAEIFVKDLISYFCWQYLSRKLNPFTNVKLKYL